MPSLSIPMSPPSLPSAVMQVFTHFMEQLNAAMYAEGMSIVILMDNASSHVLKSEGAKSEDLFGFCTCKLSNIRIVYMPPNTTCFTQPLDQGIIATAKAGYRASWLSTFTALWTENSATSAMARFKPNLRDVLAWLCDARMNIERRTIQRGAANTELDEAVGDMGILIVRLGIGSSAMPAVDFVRIDDNQPTCTEPGEDPVATEPPSAPSAEMWEAPASMQAVYDDGNPATREARCYTRAASEMLVGYERATGIMSRDLCALFDIRNPIVSCK
ncbi:unnamed protein product [Closterium sp. Naga37s-1]|nr:unnamed protein product [Closterium sp. Naga37s-1]